MSEKPRSRFKDAWNAFFSKDSENEELRTPYTGGGYGGRNPYRGSGFGTNRNSIIDPIYNRIGIDVASVDIRHIRIDENQRYIEDVDSCLNECLWLEANIDQAAAAFMRDAVMTLCETGAIAIVPVESRGNPFVSSSFDPIQLRIGTITQFQAQHVRVRLYNDQTALYEERLLPKRMCAIIENPLYSVMNEPNSILQRLLNKLRLIDMWDEKNIASKLDVIIQLPHQLKTDAKREQAENRRKALEEQLSNSELGIGYIDSTEHIHQLNRPAQNNLLAEVEWLTEMLYGQLGLTKEIVAGTADEAAMVNYFNRTIEPFLTAITQGMTRSFLSRTARTQGQRVDFFRDPFKLVPVSVVAEIADKFTRNEIASSNDIRAAIGWKPSKDKKADDLRNSNISQAKDDPEMDKIQKEMLRKELEMMGSENSDKSNFKTRSPNEDQISNLRSKEKK